MNEELINSTSIHLDELDEPVSAPTLDVDTLASPSSALPLTIILIIVAA